MKLKTKLMMFTAALALSSSMAFAAITGGDVVATYQAEAYSYISVKEGPTQIKVEAIKDGIKVEAIYDKVSGTVLSKESSTASAEDASRTGVKLRQSDHDFDKEDHGHDSASGDDGSDDNGDDDSSDDDGDDGDDDHGGGHDGGDDDSGGDDHDGGDDN